VGSIVFSGGFPGETSFGGREFHACAVAGKSRQNLKKSSKKSTAGSSRRTSHVSRGVARRAAPKTKSLGRSRPNGKKVTRRMTHAKKTAARIAPKKTVERVVPKKVVDNDVLKKATQRQGFKTNEFIVYPAHGVGQITSIEEQEVAGYKLELFVINFVKDKMTLRVPTAKIASVGMRKLAEPGIVRRALETLKGRARIKRTMWSRRAQEYEAKINSGDIVAIAEVVRDLYRSDSQPEQSYSERQLYEAALDRLSREIAAVQRVTETEAVKEIEAALAKGPRRGPKPEGDEMVDKAA
jgi:CarD family transcriptional regulator